MKPFFILISFIFGLWVAPLSGADKHDHKIIAGPLGGKVFEMEPIHVEFFVNKDRKVVVAFYDEKMKPLKPTSQSITVAAEPKSGKVSLAFDKTADTFVSKTALPEGNNYRVILQIKPTSEAKQQNFRLDYNAEICGDCKRAEYACTCEDHKDHK